MDFIFSFSLREQVSIFGDVSNPDSVYIQMTGKMGEITLDIKPGLLLYYFKSYSLSEIALFKLSLLFDKVNISF
jgi:hypothetical protein